MNFTVKVNDDGTSLVSHICDDVTAIDISVLRDAALGMVVISLGTDISKLVWEGVEEC